MHLHAYSRSRVASETEDARQARLQWLRSSVRRLQYSGASSGSPHNALHSLVIIIIIIIIIIKIIMESEVTEKFFYIFF